MALTIEEEKELLALESEFEQEGTAPSGLTPEEEEELAQLETEFAPATKEVGTLNKEEEEELALLESEFGQDPTLGQVAAGVGTEVATGIGGQLAGAAIGTAILPGVGTAIGYTVGSLGSGIAGSIAAQKLEGQEDISWGRAVAAGLINLVPGGVGKGVKGAATLGKVAAREAGKGAAFGATEATSRAIIDEGRLPTTEELAQYGGAGALFGGALGTAATKIGQKFAGKTAQQIDEAVATGEINYKDLDFMLKAGQESKPSVAKKKYEIEETIDEFGEIDYEADDALRKIARERDLGITGDRDANSVIRNENGEIVGGTFVSQDRDNYTFDVVVSKEAEGTGAGSQLLDDVIEMPFDLIDMNPDATMQVDVVSPKMKSMLERRGFVVREQIDKDRWLMEPEDYSKIGKVTDQAKFSTDQAPSMEGFLRREVANTRERVMAQEAATVLAEPNKLKMPTSMKRVFASIAPSRIAGRGAQEESIAFSNKISAAESEASRIERSVNKFIERNPRAAEQVNDFLNGADLDPSLESISPQLNRYREKMEELQGELIQQLDEGQMQHIGEDGRKALSDAIRQSQKDKNYVTREYEIFTNKNFKQDPKKRELAEKELRSFYIGEGQTVEAAGESAKKHIDHLVSRSARNMADKPQGSMAPSLEGILRQKRNPGPAERAFLGEIKDVGARMRGTLTRTAKLAARNSADKNIAEALEGAGLASRIQQEGMENLNLRSQDDTGLFVNPEVQVAINKLYADNFIDKSGDIIEDGAKDLLSSAIGLSKAVKVLGNVPSYAVQLWGNAANLAGMGINPFNPANMSRGMRLALSDFGGIEDLTKNPKARKALLDEMATMERYGLKGGNVIESDLRATFEKGLFSNTIGKAINPLGKAYSALDVMGRYVGWKANQKTAKKLFPQLDDEGVKRVAAQMINDTYQNYDKLSNTVRWATKWGVMPQFASFTAEFMRNQYNQGKMIKQMLSGTFGQDLGLKASPEQLSAMRVEGAKRLSSLLALYGGAYGITEGIKSQFGVDSEKEAALRETVLPEWDQNKQLAIALSEDGTKGSYANMSYILPQSVGISALRAGMDGTDVTSLAGLLVEELVGEGTFINKEAMRALDNRNERGKPISYSESDLVQFKDRLGYFIAQSFKPGTAREIDKAMKASRGVGDLTMREVAARQVGYRVNKFDIAEQAMFNINRTSENSKLASRSYNTARDYGNVSPQQLERTYQEANESRRESFNQLVRHNKNLETLGFNEDERIEVLKKAGVSSKDILGILDGNYTNIPRVKTPSTSEVYDELPDGRSEKLNAIRKVMREDPKLGRNLMNTFNREQRQGGLTEREKLLRRMDSDERIRFIRKHPNPDGYGRELLRKGIITQEMFRIIRQ